MFHSAFIDASCTKVPERRYGVDGRSPPKQASGAKLGAVLHPSITRNCEPQKLLASYSLVLRPILTYRTARHTMECQECRWGHRHRGPQMLPGQKWMVPINPGCVEVPVQFFRQSIMRWIPTAQYSAKLQCVPA